MSFTFAFHGVDNKIGTTMISQSVAEMIARYKKDIKVMHISLNGRRGTEYIDRIGESIEGIKIYLDTQVLCKKDLLSACRRWDNFYMLSGVMSLGQARHYQPSSAIYLLESLADEIDIIIADTGNELENGLAVGALEHIKNRCCMISQQETMLRRYELLLPIYRKLNIFFAFYAVNKYGQKDPYGLDYIAKRMTVKRKELQKIEMSHYGRRAEMESKSLLAYNDEEYVNDIRCLADKILCGFGMEPIEYRRRTKWRYLNSMNT